MDETVNFEYWRALRENGQFGVPPDMRQPLASELRELINSNQLVGLKAYLEDLSELYGVGNFKGMDDLLQVLYTDSFRDLHNKYKLALQRRLQVRAYPTMQQPAKKVNDQEMNTWGKLLTMPNFLSSRWQLYVPEVSELKPTMGTMIKRESLFGDRPAQKKKKSEKSTGDDVQKMKKSAAAKKAKLSKAKQEQAAAEAKRSQLIAGKRNPNSYGKRKTSQWTKADVSWLNRGFVERSVDGDDNLVAMLAAMDELGTPDVTDFWLLKDEIHFWLHELFNFTLAPCDFSAPSLLQSSPSALTFQTRIMWNLFKMLHAWREGQRELYTGALKSPVLSYAQWRIYMSTFFPKSASALFQEVPASGTAQMAQIDPSVLELLREIENTLTVAQEDVRMEVEMEVEEPVVQEEVLEFPAAAWMKSHLDEFDGDSSEQIPCSVANVYDYCKVGYDFSWENMQRLLISGQWLDDVTINNFFKLLSVTYPGYFASSFLLTTAAQDVQKVMRWTRKIDLNAVSRFFIPVNVKEPSPHWYLFVVDFNTRTFTVYDSIAPAYVQSNPLPFTVLKAWLKNLQQVGQLDKSHDFESWSTAVAYTAQVQQDMCGCGVFTCVFAQMVCEQAGNAILERDTDFLRDFVAEQLLKGKVIPIANVE